MKYRYEFECAWNWRVWVVGFFWTRLTFAVKIGPLHLAVWKCPI